MNTPSRPSAPSPVAAVPGDQTVNCSDRSRRRPCCEQSFILTEGEKLWFQERSLNIPTRCKPCRVANKAERNGGVAPAPGDYSAKPSSPSYGNDRDDRSGGGRSSSGRGRRNRDDDRDY